MGESSTPYISLRYRKLPSRFNDGAAAREILKNSSYGFLDDSKVRWLPEIKPHSADEDFCSP